MRKLLVALAIVVVALVIGDFVARAYATGQLRDRAKRAVPGAASTSASITSFPFTLRLLLAGQVSLVLNAISTTREAENKNLPIADDIGLTKALQGPARAIGLEHVMDCYVIWKFAQNKEGAKQFLVDYIDNFQEGFKASQYYNFPCFSSTVPDLAKKLADDPHQPAGKYKVLGDAVSWATNVGYPGYANAAVDEIFGTWVINSMFAKAAAGAMSPEDAVKEADRKCRQIFAKWHAKNLV